MVSPCTKSLQYVWIKAILQRHVSQISFTGLQLSKNIWLQLFLFHMGDVDFAQDFALIIEMMI